jgi:hypothetical protein
VETNVIARSDDLAPTTEIADRATTTECDDNGVGAMDVS